MDRVRRAAAGGKSLTATDGTLLADLKALVEPGMRGDPMGPLLWTAKSPRNLAAELQTLGHRIGHNGVAKLLRQLATTCRPIARRSRGPATPTATSSSITSTIR
jgi:hypothetical protein